MNLLVQRKEDNQTIRETDFQARDGRKNIFENGRFTKILEIPE